MTSNTELIRSIISGLEQILWEPTELVNDLEWPNKELKKMDEDVWGIACGVSWELNPDPNKAERNAN